MFINFSFRHKCESCKVLKEQLIISREHNQNLLDTILSFLKPTEVIQADTSKITAPILPKAIPWSERKRMLEERDRAQERMKLKHPEIAEDIKKLEEELGVEEDAKQN